ncbi:hypothetical protein [Maribacter sp. 2210JD10-5]|uniref:hypothetical protein n=1 Tax=Maribacter sp. 2210JD10-5 TaxID=3386272 RepID=UPI0039BD4EA9
MAPFLKNDYPGQLLLIILLCSATLFLSSCGTAKVNTTESQWTNLFNGENLDGRSKYTIMI